MSHVPSRLMAALDALDHAFASEAPLPVVGCSYCYSEQDFAALSGPLHLISDDLLSHVASEGPDHWDNPSRLYRRLVPRIVRLLVTDQLHIDEELIASRLLQVEWTTWDTRLTGALSEVWSAWWEDTLHTHPSPVSIRETLSFLTVVTNDIRPWLNIWTATHHPAADAHLADFIDDVLFEWEITDLRMGFYGEYHATPELLPWLLTDIHDRAADARLDDPYLLDPETR
ncbi:hypothetical protein [Streptomyces qinzhouensis]|uniref:Uncharacterized protein n=1 Tax=Streptomyces qinzhouensis TaxID=2599401 RepID=A0A5B8IHI2_9ACTN|nr:hypothetical protein [Streptomyces qinzhouensis]QDY76799.1 hypothetical protein FQU76_09940 [Streptomyces qinzhouensis]